MALYEIGTATGEADMLAKIHTFAVANGWTSNRNTATDINLSKGNLYENIHIDGSGTWQFKAATGFDGPSAWNAQPGQAIPTQRFVEATGSYAKYHLFTNATGDYIHIVIEVDPGTFRHAAFGQLAKPSAYDGGEYSAAVYQTSAMALDSINATMLFASGVNLELTTSYYTGCIRANYDGIGPWLTNSTQGFHGDRMGIGTDFNCIESVTHRFNRFFYDWKNDSPSTMNALTPFAPIYFFCDRTNSLWSPMGYVQDLRCCSMEAFDPGQEVTIGPDTWIVFPVSIKSDASGGGLSEKYGYAYKKN